MNIDIHFELYQYSASTYKYICLHQRFVVLLKLVINAHKSLTHAYNFKKYARNPQNKKEIRILNTPLYIQM